MKDHIIMLLALLTLIVGTLSWLHPFGPAMDSPFSLSGFTDKPVEVVIMKQCNNMEIQVSDKHALTKTDNYSILFMTTEYLYLYIYQNDTNGNTTMLLPSGYSSIKNPIQPYTTYRIPNINNWFFLDNHSGKERIVVIASKKPLSNPKTMIASTSDNGSKYSNKGIYIMERSFIHH